MAYRLELQEVDHRHLVATLLHHLSEELPPDLTLLPTSGPELRTNALALALGADRGELVEVQEAAVVLGIRLGSCQVGTRRARAGEGEELVMKEEMMLNEVKEEVNGEDSQAIFSCDYRSCKKQSKHQGHMKRHMKSHTSKLVSCAQCGEELKNSIKLKKHIARIHGPKSTVMKSEDSVDNMDMESLGVKLVCDKCPKVFLRKDKLKMHVKKYHKESENETEETLNETTDSESGMESEMTDEKTYGCSYCPKSFKHSKHLSRHKMSIHSGVTISCEECGKHFSRRDKLNSHMKNKH